MVMIYGKAAKGKSAKNLKELRNATWTKEEGGLPESFEYDMGYDWDMIVVVAIAVVIWQAMFWSII